MDIEVKLRTLAASEPTLTAYFGTTTFRWFNQQLLPGYIEQGPCVRVKRVSQVDTYLQDRGLSNLDQPKIQFDVMTWSKVTTDAAQVARDGKKAIIAWLGRVAFWTPNLTDPAPNAPNFVLSQMAGMNYELDPPGWVETFDVRLYNLEN